MNPFNLRPSYIYIARDNLILTESWLDNITHVTKSQNCSDLKNGYEVIFIGTGNVVSISTFSTLVIFNLM